MKKETFDELLTSVEQGGSILRGKKAPNRSFRIDNPNVLAIRRHLGLTQQKFAGLLGISPATLRNWEQGRRKPEGAARDNLSVSRHGIRRLFWIPCVCDLHVRKSIIGEPRGNDGVHLRKSPVRLEVVFLRKQLEIVARSLPELRLGPPTEQESFISM